ncbi:10837_t:CDS:2, partial [Ambispora gerdemannii]
VIVWDSQALVGEPQRRRRKAVSDHQNLLNFLIALGNSPEELTPNFLAEKAITDYLREMIGEATERSGDFCGSTYVDKEFLKYFETIFYPIVDQMLQLIEAQLDKRIYCSVMFVVGGFMRGAVEYGLNEDTIKTRVLKWTYGVEISLIFHPGDPPSRKTLCGRIKKFFLIAKRSLEVEVNQKVSTTMYPIKPYQ